MKKITDYRKLLGVQENTTLEDLKSIYRGLMKTWHPDKFNDDAEKKHEAEEMSKRVIEAYHFLVSIAPETRAATLDQFNATINSSFIVDFDYKNQILQINFLDGHSYEFFGVPKPIYIKLVNADAAGRFARRHIYNSYVYRSVSKIAATAQPQ